MKLLDIKYATNISSINEERLRDEIKQKNIKVVQVTNQQEETENHLYLDFKSFENFCKKNGVHILDPEDIKVKIPKKKYTNSNS